MLLKCGAQSISFSLALTVFSLRPIVKTIAYGPEINVNPYGSPTEMVRIYPTEDNFYSL